jgi:CelD/BcsL family acetyltransferase involved in cellulose biosynthesis
LVERLLDAACSKVAGWQVCRLEPISEDSLTHRHLRGALRDRDLPFDVPEHRASPYLAIQGNWDTYLAGLKKSRRQEIRRAWREAAKLGSDVRYHLLTEPAELVAYLPRLYEVSARSWKKQIRGDMGATPAARRFYRSLTDGLARAGKLAVWALEVDGRPVAMMYCLREGGRLIEMRFDFDDSHRRAGPGNALMGHVLKKSFDCGWTEHDFAGAAYGYKLAFASGVRRHVTIEAYAPRRWPRLLRRLRTLKRRWRRPKPQDGAPTRGCPARGQMP